MRGVQREPGFDLVRNVASAVVLGDKLEVDPSHLAGCGLVFDPHVRNRNLLANDTKAMPLGDLPARGGAQASDIAVDFPLELVVENDPRNAAAFLLNPSGFFLVKAVEIGVVVCLFGSHETAVHGLVAGGDAIPVKEPKAFSRKGCELARGSFRPRKRTKADQAQTHEMSEATFRFVRGAIDVLRKVEPVDHAESPQFPNRQDLGFGEAIPSISDVQDLASAQHVAALMLGGAVKRKTRRSRRRFDLAIDWHG